MYNKQICLESSDLLPRTSCFKLLKWRQLGEISYFRESMSKTGSLREFSYILSYRTSFPKIDALDSLDPQVDSGLAYNNMLYPLGMD